MPKYLLQVSYTLDGVKGVLAKGGSARVAAASAAAESAGGSLESLYFAFGGVDVFLAPGLPVEERRPLVGPEVKRLVALGAVHVRTDDDGDDYSAFLQDPEGNEFCVG